MMGEWDHIERQELAEMHCGEKIEELRREKDDDIQMLRHAIRLTRDYVGPRKMPAVKGWAWYDAIKATGGFEGFGDCGCIIYPRQALSVGVQYCNRPIDHDGPHRRD